jgi:hypothetical protein
MKGAKDIALEDMKDWIRESGEEIVPIPYLDCEDTKILNRLLEDEIEDEI